MIAATRAANRGATVAAANLRTEACDESSAMKVATVVPLPAAALMPPDAMRVLVWLRPTMRLYRANPQGRETG
jgi:hypothetical protein